MLPICVCLCLASLSVFAAAPEREKGEGEEPGLRLRPLGQHARVAETDPLAEGPLLRARPKPKIEQDYRRRLLNRIATPLDALSAYHQLTTPGQQLLDHAFYDQYNEQVKHGVERATRRAIKDYLIDVTDVDRLLRRGRSRDKDADVAAASAAAGPDLISAKRWHFDLKFSQARPKVKMRYDMGWHQLGVSVGARGDVNVELRPRIGRTSLNAGIDADGNYRLGCTIGF